MGLFNLFKSTKTVLVIDGVSLNESMGMKGKIPPRNQLQLLRRLARFSQREKVQTIVVLCGSPLNKAPGGKKFEGITVLYSKSTAAHAKYLAKTAASKGAGAVVVTGNIAIEKVIGTRSQKMRISSFRKAFDIGGDGEGNERGGNSGNSNSNRNRSPRRKQQRSSSDKGEQREPREQRRPEKKTSSDADAINELIDLVD